MTLNITDNKWFILQAKLKERFGIQPDHTAILFLIGLQELGLPFKTYSKDEKLSIIHIAICTLLEPYGIYQFTGRDENGWPHWTLIEELPPLSSSQQNKLITEAIIDYFEKHNFFND